MEVVDQGSDTAPKGVEAFGWHEVGTSMRGLMLVEVVSRSEASGKKEERISVFLFCLLRSTALHESRLALTGFAARPSAFTAAPSLQKSFVEGRVVCPLLWCEAADEPLRTVKINRAFTHSSLVFFFK